MIFKKKEYKEDFEITKNNIYLDSACMSLRPKSVVLKQKEYYEKYDSCAGRSNHDLSIKLNTEILKVRILIRKLIGAQSEEEIIFTRNTTEGINLVANCYPFNKGDVILLSDKEHNSNLAPWQKIAKEKKLNLKFFKHGDLKDFKEKIVGCTFVSTNITSNLDGTTQNASELVKIAKQNNCKIMLDCAQSIAHEEINVKKLGVDFIAFSAHKMIGPTGLGVLFGKKELLDLMPPYNVGGETVVDTTYEDYVLANLPHKFEAGLQNYSAIYAFGESISYLQKIGYKKIKQNDEKIYSLILNELSKVENLVILSKEKGSIFSFYVKGINNHDLALLLNDVKIFVRSGYHCCHSWFNANNIKGSVRASFYIYNTEEDAKTFCVELKRIINMLK
jgi:cysteine desulfurase / selenocysteine lyase